MIHKQEVHHDMLGLLLLYDRMYVYVISDLDSVEII
jgi:hypothetical protein